MKEYKVIPGWERYGISTDGEVKNFETGRILKFSYNTFGYKHIVLSSCGKRKIFTIHILMAITYLNHTRCGHKIVIDHKNGIKTDNRLVNLQLITNRENVTKDRKNGSSKYPGVNLNSRGDKWMARIGIKKYKKHLGQYDTEEEAHQAYQTALRNHLSQGGDI